MAEEKSIARALGRQVVDFVDCDGVNHRIPALAVADLADIEARLGPMVAWGDRIRNPSDAVAFIWHALRKEGLTRDQVRKKEWRWTEADAAEMFVLGDVNAITGVITALLAASGLERAAGPTRPPEAAPTGAPSLAPPAPAA